MDTLQIFISISILVALGIVIYTFVQRKDERLRTKSEELGQIGEDEVNSELIKIKDNIIILRNIILGPRRHTAEIDFVVVSDAGVYAIEVKNYSGNICGDRCAHHGLQFFESRRGYSFYNPIKQNNTHINALRHTLLKIIPEDEKHLFHSMIVFSDRSELVDIPSSSDSIIIMHTSEVADLLERTIQYNRTILRDKKISPEAIATISSLLGQYANPSDKRKQQHIRNVKSGRGYISPFSETVVKNTKMSRAANKFWYVMKGLRIIWAVMLGVVWLGAMSFIANI